MKKSYPEDSLQALAGEWWEETSDSTPAVGRLLWAFLPHVDQHPYVLVTEGRTDPTRHDRADFRLEPLRAANPPTGSRLPVAGLPHYRGEVRAVYRAKRRPALVISEGGPQLPKALRTGGARYQTNPTLLVAPFYGADQGGQTGGWKPELVDRIRRCEYPQYHWEQLPVGGRKASILRLDQIQPLGRHGEAYEPTSYKLSKDARALLGERLDWILQGELPEAGFLVEYRREVLGGG